ncbi:MAG: hypothetical protein AAFO96_11845 [Bacteroidota bacterium]
MKRLPLNKILIPIVLGIWGWVIWTYFAPDLSFSDQISSDPPVSYHISSSPTAKDTFSLALSYPDPFLKTSTTGRHSPSTATAPRNLNQVQIGQIERTTDKTPPNIVYKGSIHRIQGDSISTGIVEWRGQILTATINQNLGDIKILSFSPQKMTVAYHDSVWTILP